jgi:hypothetical protein
LAWAIQGLVSLLELLMVFIFDPFHPYGVIGWAGDKSIGYLP